MARWLVMRYTSSAAQGSLGVIPTSHEISWTVLLSTLIVFYVCVSTLLALCAFRSNPQAVVDDVQSSVRESPGELAMDSRKLSHRFSASTAAITKLSASFRISSFRDPPSFRISTFRTSDCKAQVDVVNALRRSGAVVEEDIDAEPAVWQRAILRGERCAPLSFSGLVLYDVHGNPLPSTEPPHEDLASSETTASPRNAQEEAAFSD